MKKHAPRTGHYGFWLLSGLNGITSSTDEVTDVWHLGEHPALLLLGQVGPCLRGWLHGSSCPEISGGNAYLQLLERPTFIYIQDGDTPETWR